MNQTWATGIVLLISTGLQLGLLLAFIRWVNVMFAPKPPKPVLIYPSWWDTWDDYDDEEFDEEFDEELDLIMSREAGIPEIYIGLEKDA